MRRATLTAMAVACLIVLPGASARAETPGPFPAAAHEGPGFLAPGEIDPELYVPPPPAADSPEAIAELQGLKQIVRTRSADRLAAAEADAALEDARAITEVFGPALELEHYPATARMFADLRFEDAALAKAAKTRFGRARPWEDDPDLAGDPALEACDKGASHSSYPSGHALMGYAAADLLAQLMPGNARVIQARARTYAESRTVCGVHYPSDVAASSVLAAVLVAHLLAKPAFSAEVEAARAELTAAHIAP